MITENLSTLKINKLTQEQYDRELEAGRIDEYAIYLTPGEEIDLSTYLPIDGSVPMTGVLKNETNAYQFAIKDRLLDGINFRTLWGLGKKSKSGKTIGTASVELRSDSDNYASMLNRLDLASDGELYINTTSRLFGEHNKPSGTYTGDGSEDSRDIIVGGAGNVLLVYHTNLSLWGLVTRKGICAAIGGENVVGFDNSITFKEGVLTIRGDLNQSGRTYNYQVL